MEDSFPKKKEDKRTKRCEGIKNGLSTALQIQ